MRGIAPGSSDVTSDTAAARAGSSRSSRTLGSALVVALLGAVACTNASGDVKGNEPRPGYDAAAPAPLEVPVTEDPYADAAPTTWKGIYRDFFGRRANSSCAGNGTCHDAADRPGSKISNFICADLDGCYESLRTAKDPDPRVSTHALVEEADVAAPQGAYLFKVIRYRTADGQIAENRGMPQLPRDFAFMPTEIDRMQTWIRNGAKND